MSYAELHNKTVITRKKHRCGWCGELINISDQAQYRAYVFDGDFISEWQHPECHAAMKESDPLVSADGWEEGENERGIKI